MLENYHKFMCCRFSIRFVTKWLMWIIGRNQARVFFFLAKAKANDRKVMCCEMQIGFRGDGLLLHPNSRRYCWRTRVWAQFNVSNLIYSNRFMQWQFNRYITGQYTYSPDKRLGILLYRWSAVHALGFPNHIAYLVILFLFARCQNEWSSIRYWSIYIMV